MQDSLDIERLKNHLSSLIPHDQFHYFDTIDSTNCFLKTQPDSSSWSLCLAEEQTAGRGRFGKNWISPKGVNVYCSIRLMPPSLSPLSGASLVCGLATLKALSNFMPTSNLHIKWPNDVLYQGHKISGILIERQTKALIIGIGINVNAIMPLSDNPEKPWGSIYSLTGHLTDRNALVVSLVETLSQYLDHLWKKGFLYFAEEWNVNDYLIHKKVKILIQGTECVGFARGITGTGALIFEKLNGEVHHLESGEASLLSFIA